MEWEAPKDVDKVRSFMWLVGCYRRFIQNFSHISYPITSLHKKGKKFECTEECATSFEQLKLLLKNAQFLKIVDLDKEFVACTDACKRGLGGVFMQEGQVVFYESKKPNEHDHNYVTHDLELVASIHELDMWRHYLLGWSFVFMSDHSGFRYIFDQLNMNARQAIWLETLSDFEF